MSINSMLPVSGQPKTVKEAIISILSMEWPLSAKKLYLRVRKAGLEVTYQAVHKTLKELLSGEIVEWEDKKYKLSLRWIESNASKYLETLSSYKNEDVINEKLLLKDQISLTFNNMYDFYLGMLKLMDIVASRQNNKYGLNKAPGLWCISSNEYFLSYIIRC